MEVAQPAKHVEMLQNRCVVVKQNMVVLTAHLSHKKITIIISTLNFVHLRSSRTLFLPSSRAHSRQSIARCSHACITKLILIQRTTMILLLRLSTTIAHTTIQFCQSCVWEVAMMTNVLKHVFTVKMLFWMKLVKRLLSIHLQLCVKASVAAISRISSQTQF